MAFNNPNLFSAAASGFESGEHGWFQPTNATVGVVSGQYLTGTQSLRITATAAGTASVSSPQIRPGITAGAEYICRVPIRVNTATAGKTFMVRMLFYADTGGNIGYADSTVTASATLTGWQSANYVSVSMVAPVGATQVRAVLTVTGLAAGEYVNVDDVYLGAVAARPGELLDFETSSGESGVGRWTISNGTLARFGGWLSAGAGFHCIGATSAAAGQVPVRTANMYPVTAGRQYIASAATQASVAVSVAFGIEWYNASNTWLSTSAFTHTLDATLRRIVTSGIAPEGAAKARVLVRGDATAAGQIFYLDDVSLLPPAVIAGNLLTYEEYSTESTLPAWTIEGGAIADRAYLVSGLTEGFYALKLTPEELGSGIITARLDRLVPATPGTTYQVGAVLFRHNTGAPEVINSATRVILDWYDADGNLFQPDNPDQFFPVDSGSEWYAMTVSETRKCPVGAAFARVGFQVDTASPLVDGWYADVMYLREAASEYDLVADNATGCITLTVNYIPPNGSNASNVTIQRMDEDGKAYSMRAYGRTWDLAPNPYSAMVIEDYEAPLGTRVWYSVQWSSNTGATRGPRIYTQTVTTPILADPDYVWFKSPGIPALNTTVMMEAPLKWSRAARSARYDVVGRKNPVHITGQRAGRTSSISVLVWDPEANAMFDSLLDAGTTALIQAMPGFGIDGNLYVSVGDVEVEPLSPDAREDGWRWTLDITEVDRPDGGLQGSSGSTWQSILDSSAYGTWEDLFRAHETWTTVLTKG
ncbi:hypothetical protein [Streptomyces cyaneofuscatus]|uniref:hypothetical protein n=1 Tax=Streptomyces cyaneofuscatus TaxID=66883 RepID=UPI0036314CF9